MKLSTRRRNAMLASLVLILGIAVFANWYYSGTEKSLKAADGLTEAMSDVDTPQLGDAIYVSGSQAQYFSNARLQRDESYDKTVSTLRGIIDTSDVDEQSVKTASASLDNIANKKILQTDIENLIRAKTGSDCVVVLSEDSAEIILPQNIINNDTIIQIKEIVSEKTDFSSEKITLIGVK